LEANGFTKDNLSKFLTAQTSVSARMPTDTEFQSAWISAPVYGRRLTPLRVRAVLEAIERAKRQKFHETDQLSADLSVEHVLPSEWQKHWPLPAGGVSPTSAETLQAIFATEENDSRIGQIVRRNRLLNTFGNLTVLTKPLNSSISNGPYTAKREALNKHSLLVLNREITEQESWGEDEIEARGKKLFEVACDLWPYPNAS
jgi:hypothetical protein